MRRLRSTLAAAIAVVVAAGAAGALAATRGPDVTPGKGKRGGTISVQSAEGFSHLDPGQAYFQLDYMVVYATQRALYSFRPQDAVHEVPDLATAMPKVTNGGRTVTVHIRSDVHFSPPVDRAVTSADVKYAIERGFSNAAPNGYVASYFGSIEGAPSRPASKVPSIRGIATPNRTTIVFHLSHPDGATLAQALVLPLTAPVPREYAAKLDARTPSTYDSDPTKQAFTGPYVISSYSASRGVTLTRNPNWSAKTDRRPAYADKIVWRTGGSADVVGRQVLAGDDGLLADSPTPAQLKTAYQRSRDQVTFAANGERYVALNTAKGVLRNVDVRRAIVAVTDKVGMNLVRGGALIGVPGTHFLPPGQPGFKDAGGAKGFGFDFMATPNGNRAIAARYMRKAGYPSGRYTGSQTLTVVGANEEPAPRSTQILVSGLRSLGFKVKLIQVPQSTMFTKYCGVPRLAPDICATVAWAPDFPDGYASLWAPYNGSSISPANNINLSQLDDPAVNRAMDRAAATSAPTARRRAWAHVDRLITRDAPAIPWQWSNDALFQGKRIHGVIDRWNADWNLSYSYLD